MELFCELYSSESGFDNAEFLPYINVAEGLSRLMGNKKLYARLLKSYLTNTDTTKISSLIAEGNTSAAAEAAHSVKGVSANLSIQQVYELSKELELQLKNQQDPTAALNDFVASMENSIPFIKKLIAELEQV